MAVHSFVYEALRGQVADTAGTYPKVVRMQTLPARNRLVGLLAGLVATSGAQRSRGCKQRQQRDNVHPALERQEMGARGNTRKGCQNQGCSLTKHRLDRYANPNLNTL